MASRYVVFDPDVEPPADTVHYEDFISEGDVLVWLGREKHRKTNILLQLAMCAALGRPFLKFRFAGTRPLKVVFIDYESKARSLKRRYDSICDAMNLSEAEREILKTNLRILLVREMQRAGSNVPRFPVGTPTQNQVLQHEAAETYWKQLTLSFPADFYVIDPMRCLHAQDENDSAIEQLLSDIRKVFRGATVAVAHHMRKSSGKGQNVPLKENMRDWSDSARGSGAIKAHADVIVCQERVMEKDVEIVYFGAFLKDAADIEPIPLEESDHMSFFWEVRTEVPAHLRASYDALARAGGRFTTKNAMVKVLMGADTKQKTAYRHLDDLENRGRLVEHDGEWALQSEPVVDEYEKLLATEVDVGN